MPQTKQAKKALRQSIKRTAIRKKMRADLERALKNARRALVNKNTDVTELLKLAIKKLDKAAQKKLIKKNKAGRDKSRLMKHYNKIK